MIGTVMVMVYLALCMILGATLSMLLIKWIEKRWMSKWLSEGTGNIACANRRGK